MKQIFILAFGIFILTGCGKKETPYTETTFLQFRPRICDKIAAISVKKPGNLFYGLGEEPIKPNDYYICVHTGDRYLDSAKAFFNNYREANFNPFYLMLNFLDSKNGLAASIPALESQLLKDYVKTSGGVYSGPAGNVEPWPYRVTGVKNFTITALSPLFGKAAGISLNDHFTIEQFYPDYQFPSQTIGLGI